MSENAGNGPRRSAGSADHRRRAREKRRAVALRENLRRRKAQMRERGGPQSGNGGG